MYLTIFDEVEPSGQESVAIDVASLYSEFEKVKDGRGEKGKRYPLPLLSHELRNEVGKGSGGVKK